MADTAPSDDHLFDDAPQGVGPSPAGAAAAQAVASQAQPQPHPSLTQAATPDDDHLFDDAPQGMPDSSAAGAFARGAGFGAAPSVGGLAGAGVGAEAGAALGEAVFPAGGGIIGGIAGGLAGAFGGGAAVQKGQDWLISKLPQSWQDKLNEQEQADTAQHPVAQFMGGLAPFAVTMSPTTAVSKLPENATNLTKLMANPVTQRMFSGAVMGGTELGNEYASGQSPDWAKVGIATGAGMIFSRPNAIGEKILAAPFGGVARDSATLAQAGDAKVMGPGVTEEVFHGQEQQAPQAEMQAQQAARDEKMALEGPPTPEVAQAARGFAPDIFHAYDAAQERLASLQNEVVPAPPERLAEAQRHIDELGPEIANAYRTAAESTGAETVAPEQTPPAPEAAATAGEAQPPEAPPQPIQSREDVKNDIVQHITDQLKGTKYSDQQINDFALVNAALYDTVAARTGGSARDLYDRWGPLWNTKGVQKTVRPNVLELTQEPAPQPAEVGPPVIAQEPQEKGAVHTVAEFFRQQAQNKAEEDAAYPAAHQMMAEKGVETAEKWYGDTLDAIHARENEQAKAYEAAFKQREGEIGRKMTRQDAEDLIAEAKKLNALPPTERELSQGAKGKVRIVEGKRPIATLFKDADFSTLIHEGVGHPLLEMMGELAEHPDAPPDIRDDWQTVKDWLGVKGREDIQTRQHEKFARGFEQYVREGVAPSPGLARTFSRIKQWMTAIYQTLKGLGKPINDDIRQVFDRLLAEEPHPTVIMPETERGPTLADIHEADAKITHPKDADAAGDRVVAERDRAIQEHEPEIAQALAGEEQRIDAEAAKSAGETDAGAGGHGEVGVDSGESEYQPRSGTLGETGGEEQRGGGATVSKSGGLAGSESGGSGGEPAGGRNAGAGSGNAMAPAAAPRLESRNPSGLTDKAGNIRLENLTDDADARRAIRESAQENNDFLGDRRGIVTDQQVDDLATALGMNQSLLLKRRIGQAFNAEQIIAARRLLIQSATQVSDLMKKAATGTDADVMAYAEGRSRHQMIQGVVSGVTAEAGRALRAFRNIAGSQEAMQVDQFLRDATGKTLFQMKEEAKLGAQLGTPEAVSSFVDKAGKPTFGRMVLEYWINGLISGIPTHVTYTIGNFLLAGERTLFETPAAAAIGALRAGMGREGNVIPFGATAAKIRGAVKGIPVGMEAAAQAARTGNTTLLPGETPKGAFALQYGGALNEGATYGDAMKAWYGIGRGLWDGALSAGQLAAAGGDPSAPFIASTASRGYIPNLAVKGVPLPVGEVLRAPGRMIATIHSFFRALNYSIEMNGLEFQRAWGEGQRGDALAQRVADLRLNRNPEDMESARGEATQATLMGEGGKFTKAVSSLLNSEFNLGPLGPTPILKFIDPFIHISSNIINQAIVQRTPLGILAPSIRADLMGKNGPIASDKAAARMLVGSALAMTFGMLAANGFVTGAGPQDRNKAAAWKLAGYQAHSVRINDTWYDLHRLGPLGMLLGMSADLYDLAGVAQKDDFATAAGAFQHAITQSVLDESFMRGPSELLKALEDKSYAPIYVRNFVSSFVPFSVGMGYETRAMDPYQRQTRTIMDAIKAKIPGQSESLWPRIDSWGNPMPTQEALGGNAVTALWMNKISSDPVNQEMVRLGIGKPPVPRSIRNQKLTDPQYDEFARMAGKMTKSNLDRIVNSSQWSAIPDSAKTQIVDEIFRQSREGARGLMMARHPEIANGAVQQKLTRRTGANIRPLQ